MSRQTVFGIAESEAHAVMVISELIQAGFAENSISFLLPDKAGWAGSGPNGILGGAAGLLSATGNFFIPELGAIVVGPLFSVLSGGSAAALGPAFIGIGIREPEAKQYEEKMFEGSILISVEVENEKEKEWANEVFKKSELHDIAVSHEAAA